MIVREPIGVVGRCAAVELPAADAGLEDRPGAGRRQFRDREARRANLAHRLRVAELAAEAGVPRGVLNVLPGRRPGGGRTARACTWMWTWSRFTGSTETGRRFLRYAADSNLKKIVLECGGKNPAIVLDDAENLDRVADHVVNAAFWNMGENCSATSRLIVHEAVKDALLARILARLREWKTGDPLDPANRLGALVDKAHCDKVCGYLNRQGQACWLAARSTAAS